VRQRTVTIFVGLPGAGKSYGHWLAKGRGDWPVFSPDYLLFRRGQYAWSKKHSAQAWASCYRFLGKWLRVDTQRCTWDATFVTPISRSAILGIAKGYGCRVEAIYFKTPLRTCLARNAKRSLDRQVPEATIREMHRQLVPPTKAEGFDSVKVVRWLRK